MSFTFRHEFDRYLRRATPCLPEDMRRLIDEAVAAGRVTRVPCGVSSMPYPIWSPSENALVEADPKTAVQKHREAIARSTRAARIKRQSGAVELRQQIVALHTDGHGVMEIARSLDVNRKTVSKHLAIHRALSGGGARGTNVSALYAERNEQAQKRRAQVWTLYQQGRSYREIAEAVGSSQKRVAKDIFVMRRAQRSCDIAAEGVAA